MDSRAKRRLALTIAATLAVAAMTADPLYACENCPPGPNTAGVAANALPTYPEPTEEKAAEQKSAKPISLKKFTKSQTRTTRQASPRNSASLSQRARGSKSAARKAGETEQQAPAPGDKAEKKVAPTIANANAALVEAPAAKASAAEVSEAVRPAATEPRSEAVQSAVGLVSAEEFNDLDRAAWEANQMPRLMQLTASDSRAELRDDDSKWAQTSTIGKLFVAFGALLTIGSALRMFLA